jgi:hypothetical protein
MKTLSDRIDALFLSIENDAIVKKVSIETTARPAFISARYELTRSALDKDGKPAIVFSYQARKLRAIEQPTTPESFIIYTGAGFKIPTVIDAVRLAHLFKTQTNIKTTCFYDVAYCLNRAKESDWIIEFKTAVKEKMIVTLHDLIVKNLRPNFIGSNGNMDGIEFKYRGTLDTVQKLFIGLGICPRQNATVLNDLIQYANKISLAGYTIRAITDPNEINEIYARNDDFGSCMRGMATPARIYQPYSFTPDGEPLQSIVLNVIEKDGDFIGRFATRVKSGKYPTLYTDESTQHIEAVLLALGHERNPSAFYGARLPLVTDENDCIYMPYIDGDNKEIRLIESEQGQFLQLGGTKGDYIGDATTTRGFLSINSTGQDKGFRDSYGRDTLAGYEEEDENENNFYCEHCEEYHNEQYYNSVNGTAICDDCLSNHFTSCEDCDTYTAIDECYNIEVLDHSDDTTDTRTLCECCVTDDYYQEPINQEYYFRLADFKRHILGIR